MKYSDNAADIAEKWDWVMIINRQPVSLGKEGLLGLFIGSTAI